MNRLTLIKENFIDPALRSSDLLTREKASSILRSVAEAEKLESDIHTSTYAVRAERLRFWIPILAPVITAFALIGTLVFQIQQFKDSARLQRLANEDTQWREAVSYAKSTEGLESTIAFTLIKSFFDSDRYESQAREVSVVLLGGVANPTIFDENFAPLLERTTWDNLKDIANIARIQAGMYAQYREDAKGLETQPKQSSTMTPDPATRNLVYYRNGAEANVITTTKGLLRFLRDSRNQPRPANIVLDLSGCAIWTEDISNMDFVGSKLDGIWIDDSNLSGANFTRAKLDKAYIGNSDVKDADFSGVQAKDSNWEGTAWWRAKNMNPDLLEYLQDKFRFSLNGKYRYDKTKDFAEYEKNVDRLSKSR